MSLVLYKCCTVYFAVMLSCCTLYTLISYTIMCARCFVVDSSFVPPLIYAVFGSSKYVAIGTLAASSMLISSTLEEKASPIDNPDLYLGLVFTATLISGLLQLALGLLRWRHQLLKT